MNVRPRRPPAAALISLAGAYALAFAQRPGLLTADTKIHLHVAPGRFLHQAAAMWAPTGQLGGVQAGQQTGYLFPMGPFFAAGHALGVPDWVVQRLWLGSLLAATALGVIALLGVLLDRPPIVAQLAGAAVAVLNPFVVTYVNRTTVSLLALAVLPWLLLAVHRGLREPARWRWPALIALLVTISGPGVNAAVTGWMLLGPVLLVVYEVITEPQLRGRAAWRFGASALGLTLLLSLWWAIPAYIQSAYGNDFLRFTEQPGTVWGTTSATETLRLMGFWLSYVGVGFGGPAIPYFEDSRTLLFSPAVVVATLLLPAAAFGGFVWTRRWRHGPFFVLLAIVAALVIGAGYPDGTPLRHGLYFLYNHVAALQFLRTSYKAAPLLVVSFAMLIAAAAGCGWPRLRKAGARAAAVLSGLLVLALAGWPLVTGQAQDAQVSLHAVPAAWRAAAARLPASGRTVVLPGNLFSFYTWGGAVDPILPTLTSRPVAERTEVPYADPHAADLLWEMNDLVSQRRLLPGQLSPLLSLAGAGSVITATDSDRRRSDAPPPADIAAELLAQAGFRRRASAYGPQRSFSRTDAPGPALTLPEVRAYVPATARPDVRVEPRSAPLIVDGSAATLAGLAAFGELRGPAQAILYAADLGAHGVRAALAGGGELVIGDSNRRRALVAGTLEQNAGPVLFPRDSVSADGVILDPFGRGPDAETVATSAGLADVHAPASPERAQFPEHAASAALDADPATFWIADPSLDPSRHWVEADFRATRDIPYVDLLPYGPVRSVALTGRTFAVHPGWNHLVLGLHRAASLRVALGSVGTGPVGIRDLRIPGLQTEAALRLPVDGARAVRGRDLGRVGLEYVFERVTGDQPFLRDALAPEDPQNVSQPGDAERTFARRFLVPARRKFTARAWVSIAPDAPDPAIDSLAGLNSDIRATSSSRAAGLAGFRASQALDGRVATAWVGEWRPGGATWIAWQTPRPARLEVLRLRVPAIPVRRPAIVELSWPGGRSGALPVAPDGSVRLRRSLRTASVRLTVLAAAAPRGAGPAGRRAVGIAEITGAGVPRVRVASPRAGLHAGCATVGLQVGGGRIGLRPTGSVAALASGAPLAARSCAPVTLGAGPALLRTLPGPLLVDELSLRSAAPQPASAVPATPVVQARTRQDGTPVSAEVHIDRPSWLVIGQGYDRGWQASCNGRSLGAPVPIDGYATGWSIGAACRHVSFSFGPQRAADIGYLLSLIGSLLCLMLCLASRAPRAGRSAPAVSDAQTIVRRLAPLRAIAWALPLAAGFGFVFGARAGAVALPLITLGLWRGAGAVPLAALAGGLLAGPVPVLYLLHTGGAAGGNHAGYAAAHATAHWLGVTAIGLMVAAAAQALATSSRVGASSLSRSG